MILHISQNSAKYPNKFLPGLQRFTDSNLKESKDHLYVYEGDSTGLDKNNPQLIFIDEITKGVIQKYISIYRYMRRADKIFIHGPFSQVVLLIFSTHKALLKKTYWVMWGTDLYQQDKDYGSLFKVGPRYYLKNKLKAAVIRNIGYLVTFLPGDVELARQLYGAKGTYAESFVYPSNLCKLHPIATTEQNNLSIIVGNSAYPRNNHLAVFSLIHALRETTSRRIKVYVPLSYGGTTGYINQVIEKGKTMFGADFIPLTSFMPLEEYLSILSRINIAINASERQQSLGNTISLLGVGAKVFMYKSVSQWSFFEALGVKVFDICDLDLNPLSPEDIDHNRKIIADYFSIDTLRKQLYRLYS